MSPLGAVCLHGQLARSCAVCELTEELERVRQERDRARQQLGQYLDGECWVAVSEFRRVVEERDEARAEVDLIKVQWQEAAAWREQIHAVECEREEALDARAQALTVLARLERERDELRDALSSTWRTSDMDPQRLCVNLAKVYRSDSEDVDLANALLAEVRDLVELDCDVDLLAKIDAALGGQA